MVLRYEHLISGSPVEVERMHLVQPGYSAMLTRMLLNSFPREIEQNLLSPDPFLTFCSTTAIQRCTDS